MTQLKINPKLDLVLERTVDVPRELVWAAWTKPEHIVKWFTPAPWVTTHCEIDLRPGYRPSEKPFFTAVIALEKQGKGTRYTATAIHRDEAGRKQHEEMGFHQGWGTALDQLVAHVKTM